MPKIRGSAPGGGTWLGRSPLKLQIEVKVKSGDQIDVSPPLTVNLFDPCEETEIQEQMLQTMVSKQNSGTPVVQNFQPFKDSVSIEHGDGSGHDLCVPQTYSLLKLEGGARVSPPQEVTLDSNARTITLQTDENTDIGSYYMILVVMWPDFNIAHEEPFEVIIDNCEIDFLDVV